MKLGEILLVLSLVLFFQGNYPSTTLAENFSYSYVDPNTGITTTTQGNPDGSRTVTKTDKDGNVISKKTLPPRVKVKPKDKRIIVRKGLKVDAVAVPIVIRYRFYLAEGMKFLVDQQGRWVEAIDWWVERFNKKCGNKIGGVKSMNQVSKRTRRAKRDIEALTHEEEQPDGKVRTYRYTRFAKADQEDKVTDKKDTYVFSKARLRRLIGKTNSTRDFHIGVFKEVRSAISTEGKVSGRGTGGRPGIFCGTNVIAIKSANTTLGDKLHEMGHMFGLEHKEQGDFGIMKKKSQIRGAMETWYGDRDYWGDHWCDKISRHLGIE